MEILIRDYQEKDFDAVNQILQESFSVKKETKEASSSVVELVAESLGVVCGYMVLTKVYNPVLNCNYYLIDYVCVGSLYRRQGVAKQLLASAYEIARSNKAMYLQLTSSRFREAAHKLYLGFGFVKRETDVFRKDII